VAPPARPLDAPPPTARFAAPGDGGHAPPTSTREAGESERSLVAAIVEDVAAQLRSGQIQVAAGSAKGDTAAVLASVLAAVLAKRA
jgi:hypothetical protein